jgi:RNA polymerase sigma-70 factor, ECF subfamily
VSTPSRAPVQDEQAFMDCVTAHAPSLRRFARRLTRNHADAEDVFQQTLMRALEKRGELRDPAHLRPWLLAIARTSWLNSRRGLRNKLEVLEGGGALSTDEGARGDLEGEILDRSLTDELLLALDALPEEWRETLWLREVEDLSYEEIARVLGCPLGTVRSRLARARAAAAACLGKGGVHGL